MTRGGLNRREAFATRATTAGERGATAPGGLFGKEPVLAFAADFRRLILAFHKFKKSCPAQKPERGRISVKPIESRRGSGCVLGKHSTLNIQHSTPKVGKCGPRAP
jgi:hypothetical protein